MGANEWVLIALAALSIFTAVIGFLGAWAFKETIALGKEVSRFEERFENGNKEFTVQRETNVRMELKIDHLTEIVNDLRLRIPKRAGDSDGHQRIT